MMLKIIQLSYFIKLLLCKIHVLVEYFNKARTTCYQKVCTFLISEDSPDEFADFPGVSHGLLQLPLIADQLLLDALHSVLVHP